VSALANFPDWEDDITPDDLEAASEMFDSLIAGTMYPPAGSKIGPFTVRYLREQEA
jgi:hypothetical protein